jgi:catechol 2,3-dioxygenase-like lactoylglutathione lyase family enzyme
VLSDRLFAASPDGAVHRPLGPPSRARGTHGWRDVCRSLPRFARVVLTVAFVSNNAFAGEPSTNASSAPVSAVDSVAMTVSDIDRAVDFYSRVLTFRKVADREVAGEEYEHLFGVFGLRVRAVRMRLGEESIELMQFLAPRGRPVPVDSRSNDGWFQHIAIIVNDMSTAYARLRSFHVEYASSGPQRLPDWNPNAGGIQAFYFRDPDGHNLEVLEFPPGKGPAKWHTHDGRIFLGIDHTAIVVSDTEASLHFYRDVLGLRVAGTSENYGTEQEHLNNVFGAHLRITSLRASEGPGVEFLEYLAPRTGRPLPPDTQPNDLWYWQIIMSALEPRALEHPLREAHASLVSTETTRLQHSAFGWRDAMITRDPDGHATLVASQLGPAGSARRSPPAIAHVP